MFTSQRLRREQEFHDRQAETRRQSWLGDERALRFDDAGYVQHEPWIRPALDWLGDVRGLPVLDLGCGHGMASVVLARRGARATGLDLSSGYLSEARSRAGVNQVDVAWVQADGESLPFADDSFARVWGNAILHHLDLERTAAELRRILQPGGWAIFCEPWGGNLILNWARRHLPYPGKQRTPDEQPLTCHDLRRLARFFPNMQVTGFQLLGMAKKLLGPGVKHVLEHCDQHLLARIPALQGFCRYVVLRLPV